MAQNGFSSGNNRQKALFLDRDGVIVEYIPYLSQPEQVNLPLGAGEALHQWQKAGYLLIVITNQSGVGRGYFSLEDVEAVHRHIQRKYRTFGVNFTDILLCPHHPDGGCSCRKPSPQMILTAAEQYQIDLTQSYFLGDTMGDLNCALQAGCQPLLVLTGLGRETQAQLREVSTPIPCFERVADTVLLLGQQRQGRCW